MGDKRTQRQVDAYELGSVENVHDLDPDQQVGPSRKATTQERIINPSAAGYFEIEGGSSGGLGAPLHLGPELKKDGGSAIAQYEAGYNSYSVPLRSTLRAMGRLKDVSMSGAPLTPSELLQRPDLAKKFRKLNQTSGDVQQDQAFDVWSSQQTKMRNDIQRFGGGQHELAAAIAEFRRVELLLDQRRKEAKIAAKTSEIADIDRTVHTLTKIVDVAVEGWGAINEIEALVGSGMELDEDIPDGDAGAQPSGGVNWEHGTVGDPSGASTPTKSATQRAAGAYQSMSSAGGMGAKIASEAKRQISKAGNFELSLESVFTIALGKGKAYKDLKVEVATLNAQIKKLQLDSEAEGIRAASEQLTGFKMEFVARRMDVQADRVAARKGARTFAKSMGAGADGITAMYAAEVYQELAAFGQLAAEQRQSMVDPVWGAAHGYVHGYDKHRFLAIGAADDAMELATNLQAVREQRAHFAKELPQWNQRAQQWNNFLGTRTNSPLVAEENEADRSSEAP